MGPVTRKNWESAFSRVSADADRFKAESTPSLEELEAVRLKFLGRKGSLTALLKNLRELPLEERKILGPRAQDLREDLESRIETRRKALERSADEVQLRTAPFDVTLPSYRPARGRLHPLTQTTREMTRILSTMGFSWAEGPSVETDRHNFTALNIPPHHSARDLQDTFYLKDSPLLMRTHTSPVQIRAMEAQRPPLRIICPGRVFRHEAVDATHSAVFHQIEGLYVDKNVTFADLKGTLNAFLQRLFGSKTRTLFRPSYYPFTEPSADVFATCVFCAGAGCPVCKQTGFIEVLGAGIVHPNVFSAVDYDPLVWSGFAFGVGVERIAMLSLGIKDIRQFYENDRRFLEQFDENLV